METQNAQKTAHIAHSFTWRDAVIVCYAVVAAVGAAVFAYRHPGTHARVTISSPEGEYIYDLSQDRNIAIKGAAGISVIAIENGTARFLSSPCENQLCVLHAPIRTAHEWAACLPNAVFLMIETDEDAPVDATAF
ncbi:MAG: NusG domain II-containing protein [Treponema sp.]|nr:NusG domain II-containing protein [Treponema sp.]